MDLAKEVDDYIKESIDHSLGLPVSSHTLELKLQASEDAQRRLRNHCVVIQSKLKDKDQVIERTRAEATINAQALKKFVEENQKLASECVLLLGQCNKWEKECSLYDRDREILMDFGNEADQRAREAEIRIHELEEEVKRMSDELKSYKNEYEMRMLDSSAEGMAVEETLLEAVLSTLTSNNGTLSARAFLEANNGLEPCQRLLKMWNYLKPSTQRVLSLAAGVNVLENDKDHLRINLHTAEEEARLLSEQNKMLDEENKRLMRQYQKERSHQSGGKQGSNSSAKSNKRKSGYKMSETMEGKINFDDHDLTRRPLSPLQHNSPDSRMLKK